MAHCRTHDPIGDWPFKDLPNTEAFTTKPIAMGSDAIMLVYHDHDGAWQFHGADESTSCVLLCLQCLVERDPSIMKLADLPVGWLASRDHIGSDWKRSPFAKEPE